MKAFLWTSVIVLSLLVVGVWVVAFRLNSSDPNKEASNYPATGSDVVTTNTAPPTSGSGKSPAQFVPILMYHYIRSGVDPSDNLGIQLSVSPEKFRQQLSVLKDAGYQTISLSDFAAGKYKPKSLVVTFDDGYVDQHDNALPILKELDMKATFFIVRNFIGTNGYMNKTQIDNLLIAGMEVGGHSMSHKNLANLEYEQQTKDIAGSMENFAKVFCYPSGKYSPVTLDIVSGLGVKAAVTTIYGIATDQSKIYELPRIRMVEHTDILKRISEETAIAKKQLSPSQRTKD